MNHWIAKRRLAVIVSKIVKHVQIHTAFTSYAWNVCIQYECKHTDVQWTAWYKVFTQFRCIVSVNIWDLCIRWRWKFRSVKTEHWQSVKTVTASRVSMIHYNVHVSTEDSICHIKFLMLVLAHILGEVSTFCIVLLSVSSRIQWQTQSKKLAHFFETWCTWCSIISRTHSFKWHN